MKRKLILLTLLALLIVAFSVCVSAEEEKMIPAQELLGIIENNTTANKHPYVDIINAAIKKHTDKYESPVGLLYDVDGNGTQELMLYWVAGEIHYYTGNYMDAAYYSIYTLNGNTAVPLVSDRVLYYYAAADFGAVYIVVKGGREYIAVQTRNSDASYSFEQWHLYDGTSSVPVESASCYEKYYVSTGNINTSQSYSMINGVEYSYKKFYTWLANFEICQDVYYQSGIPLSELLEQAKRLPAAYNGLVVVDGVWGYYKNGVHQTDYTGLVPYGDILFYVENGILDFSYTGLVWHNDAWTYVANSQLTEGYTGLVWFEGEWFYVVDSVIDWTFTGLVPYEGNYFYVQNNHLDWSYTGLGYHDGGWYFIQNGLLQKEYSGLVYFNDNWFYVEEGVLTYQFFGMVEYQGNLFYVQASHLDWSYTGLGYHEGAWYYFQNALYTPSFTGLVPFNGSLFYVKDGTIDWSFNGEAEYDGTTYTVVNGAVEQ